MKLPVVFLLVLLGVASASGASFTANPTIDALVSTGPNGNRANDNYGGAGALSLSAAGLEMGELQSVLQFNFAGAVSAFNAQYGAGQWTVDSVSLRLTIGNANNPIFNSPAAGAFRISLMQNDSWLEGNGSPNAPDTVGITFNTLQSTFIGPSDESLGVFAYSGATSGSSTYALGLSPGLLGDLLAGGNASLRLYAADSAVSAVFSSRNFGTVGNRPLLTVVAVPEPGPLVLGGLALIFFVIRRLRGRAY